MASEPTPGSTGGVPPNPPAPSAAAAYVTCRQRCVVLVDWWLERVEGEEGKICIAGIPYDPKSREGASSSKGNGNVARRVFRSAAIARRHEDREIETEDGYTIKIGRLLNIPRTRDNGFSKEVCTWFEFGFPHDWFNRVNPNMEQQNEQAESQSQSESTANEPKHSVKYYMEQILNASHTNIMRYALEETDIYSSIGYANNRNESAIPSLSKSTNMAASLGLHGGKTNMPEKPLTPPRETCSGQESHQHEGMQIDTSGQGLDIRSIRSFPVNQSTGSICPNSEVDANILTTSEIVLVEKEGYRRRADCGQVEEGNMQICSSEQEIVALPIDSAIVNENVNTTSSGLGEPGTPKCGKTSVNLTERMNPQFGAVQDSEGSTIRRLRSRKVFGTPTGRPMKSGHKQKKKQHEASDQNVVPNEGATSTADLTSHGNDSSAARTVTEGREKSVKKVRKRKRESGKLFWNWL
ncbi:unnamed protein product [Urochloa humidicola]